LINNDSINALLKNIKKIATGYSHLYALALTHPNSMVLVPQIIDPQVGIRLPHLTAFSLERCVEVRLACINIEQGSGALILNIKPTL